MGFAKAIVNNRSSQSESLIKGSEEQERFWDSLLTKEEHLILKARAGTGKTFSCIEGIKRLPRNVRSAVVAYNKPIQVELSQKVPRNVPAYTAHALGFKAVRDQGFLRKSDGLSDWKTLNLLKVIMGGNKYFSLKSETLHAIKKTVDLCKNTLTGCDPSGVQGSKILWDEEIIPNLITRYAIDVPMKDIAILDRYVPELLEMSLSTDVDVIDFSDMVWLPVMHRWDVEQFDILFVDECQDLNRARQELAFMAGDRLVCVGDERQAIYGFSGADAESMANLESWFGAEDRGVEVLPLTVSRRCPKSHVESVTDIVPDFKAMDDAIQGTINNSNHEGFLDRATPGDLVECRTNAPLTRAAYQLLCQDTPVQIQGRDFGAQLTSFIKTFEQDGVSSLAELRKRVDLYEAGEVQRMSEQGLSETAIQSLGDRCECVRQLSRGLDSMSSLTKRIKNLFVEVNSTEADGKKKKKYVLLSSVHRAKGLEAKNTWILKPELMPFPYAKQDWEMEQESNIKYVAQTRSLDSMTFVRDN